MSEQREKRLVKVSLLALRLGDVSANLSVLEADNHVRIKELTAPPQRKEAVS